MSRGRRSGRALQDGRGGRGVAFARVGLLGNPSDAYRGKVIAFSVYELRAEVRASASSASRSLQVPDGPAQALLEAACARYLRLTGVPADRLGHRLSFDSGIPFQAGLAGSSALVIACLRALGSVFEAPLDPRVQAETALAVEVEDLGQAAGPMDRVIQAFEGALHMDFSEGPATARYTALDRARLPALFVAWHGEGGRASGDVHADVRARWLRREPRVVDGMRAFARLVDRGMRALERRDAAGFRSVVDENFDLRCRFFEVEANDREMVALARDGGAAAKLCGSGGAVVVLPPRERDLAHLTKRFEDAGYRTLVPDLAGERNEPSGACLR